MKRKELLTFLGELCIVAVIFLVLPFLIVDTGSAMGILLIATPLLCVGISAAFGCWMSLRTVLLWVPLASVVLFFAAMLLHYNETAWGYGVAYAVLLAAGGGTGYWIRKRPRPQK